MPSSDTHPLQATPLFGVGLPGQEAGSSAVTLICLVPVALKVTVGSPHLSSLS